MTGINFFGTELVGKAAGAPARASRPAHSRGGPARQSAMLTANAETTLRRYRGRGARASGMQIQVLNADGRRRDRCGLRTLVREADATRSHRKPSPILFDEPAVHCPTRQRATRSRRYIRRVNMSEAGGLMSYGANLADAVPSHRRLCRHASSRARSRRTCRSCSRPSSSWSSTSRPPGRSASTVPPTSCSRAPTR